MTEQDRDILRIALPAIITNITVPLLGLADVTIMGHTGGATHIGAISVGSMIFNTIYWVLGFLRMGTTGLTSQSFGRHDFVAASATLLRSLSIALSLGLTFIIFQGPLWSGAVAVIHPTSDLHDLAYQYFSVCIWGAPATLCLYSLTGWFIGMQDTRTPMFISILQNLINIGASLYFVLHLNLGVRGIALGTLTAQYAGLLLALTGLWRYRLSLTPSSLSALCDSTALGRFFSVNRDIFLRTLFLVAVNLFFTSAGASQGAVILSVNTLLFQLFTLYSYVMDGFAFAGEALGGRYYGASDRMQFKSTVSRLFRWCLALTTAYTFIYIIGGTPFLGLLTDDMQVISAATPYVPWAWAIPFAGMGAFYWDGLFIGMTATRGMLAATFVGASIFFTTYWLAFPLWHNHALWLALMLYLAGRGLTQTIIFRLTTQEN